MRPTISLENLESHLWEAANILRGPVDAADFKTYVFPLEDIRAKDGNLSIPLFVAPVSAVRQDEAGYRVAGLDEALASLLSTQKD